MNQHVLSTPNIHSLLSSPNLVELISTQLEALVLSNDGFDKTEFVTSRFSAKEKPKLDLINYLNRLIQYTPHPKDGLLHCLYLLMILSRIPPTRDASVEASHLTPVHLFPLLSAPPNLPIASSNSTILVPLINSYTIHRILLSTLLLSSKFLSDAYIPQARAAKVAGVDLREITKLEFEIFKIFDWNITGGKVEDLEMICGILLGLEEEAFIVSGTIVLKAEDTKLNNIEKQLETPGFSSPALKPLMAPTLSRTSSEVSSTNSNHLLFSPSSIGSNPSSPPSPTIPFGTCKQEELTEAVAGLQVR